MAAARRHPAPSCERKARLPSAAAARFLQETVLHGAAAFGSRCPGSAVALDGAALSAGFRGADWRSGRTPFGALLMMPPHAVVRTVFDLRLPSAVAGQHALGRRHAPSGACGHGARRALHAGASYHGGRSGCRRRAPDSFRALRNAPRHRAPKTICLAPVAFTLSLGVFRIFTTPHVQCCG
eukprot:14275403-Alexandrium_andersonii.AAC.1